MEGLEPRTVRSICRSWPIPHNNNNNNNNNNMLIYHVPQILSESYWLCGYGSLFVNTSPGPCTCHKVTTDRPKNQKASSTTQLNWTLTSCLQTETPKRRSCHKDCRCEERNPMANPSAWGAHQWAPKPGPYSHRTANLVPKQRFAPSSTPGPTHLLAEHCQLLHCHWKLKIAFHQKLEHTMLLPCSAHDPLLELDLVGAFKV